MPKKITLTFYWDEQWKQLYSDKRMKQSVATRFFSDEQLRELHQQTGIEAPNPERSVAENPQ